MDILNEQSAKERGKGVEREGTTIKSSNMNILSYFHLYWAKI